MRKTKLEKRRTKSTSKRSEQKIDYPRIGQAKTHAMTPDKMDRSSRKTVEEQFTQGNNKPYPLTEEEATPQIPESEERA